MPSALRPARPATSLAAVALLAACVTATTITYLPSADQPRLDLPGGRAMLERFVAIECPRLVEAGRTAGSARVLIALDSAGTATSAELDGSTGDSRVDGVVGAVAAQLQLPPSAASGARATLRAGYQCGAASAVRVTLDRA